MRITNNTYTPSFEQKYRVILTKACPRACKDCINTFDPVISKAERVNLTDIISDGDDIVLTGGEPAIYPHLEKVIDTLKIQNPKAKMFIYSATANKRLIDVLPKVDGLSFTIHDDASDLDIGAFRKMQKSLKSLKSENPQKSYRLYIDDRLQKEVPIEPNLYSRIDRIKWMSEEEVLALKDRNFGCPADEKLVILNDIAVS